VWQAFLSTAIITTTTITAKCDSNAARTEGAKPIVRAFFGIAKVDAVFRKWEGPQGTGAVWR
jgi:hypothetical protein